MSDFARGDEQAFREIFRRYAPLIMAIMRQAVRREADAQDLTQQTFLQLHRARGDFRPAMRLRPWIITIARNLSRDLIRRRGRWQETEVDDLAAPEREADDDAEDRARKVREAVARLPERQRRVIELHWFERRSFAEIGKELGSTSGAERIRAHRGYVALRAVLAGV
jgi:RNA polymerase sigma-70 factor (ECF subfamily)